MPQHPNVSRSVLRLGLLGILLLPALPAFASVWEPAPSFPDGSEGRRFAVGLEVDGTLLALGGTPWDPPSDPNGAVHALAPGDPAWHALPPLEGPFYRVGAGIDALGRIVVFAGYDPESGDTGNVYVYDLVEGPTDGLADRSDLAPAQHFAFAVDDAGRLYSIGGGPGAEASPSDPNSARVERYLPDLDQWEALAPVPYEVAGAAAVNDGRGRILVLGGIDTHASTRLAAVAAFDVAAGTWSPGAVDPLPEPLSGLRAVRGADGRVYALGGESGPLSGGAVRNTVYVLDVDAGTWSAGPSMITARLEFGAVLGADDCIYAMGGSDGGSGTRRVEKLYTPRCPVFPSGPVDVAAWNGTTAVIEAEVAGGDPMTLRWMKDGEPIQDGPAPGGGTISGSDTPVLTITAVGAADAGAYRLAAENPCGLLESDPADLLVRFPPEIPTEWQVIDLHPAWAIASRAQGVSGAVQVGSATVLTEGQPREHAVLWTGDAASALDLNPPETLVSGAAAASGSVQAGFWYKPYEIWQNGQWVLVYYRHACRWNGSVASHEDIHPSGYEYSHVTDMAGADLVGTASYDDPVGNYYSRAGIWPAGGSFRSLHPQDVSNSFAQAAADGRQFGSTHTWPGSQIRAAGWSGSAASFEDMHPDGAGTSRIAGAGDGLQVGTVTIGGADHAALWSGTASSFLDLHPSGAAESEIVATAAGLHVGSRMAGGGGTACLWSAASAEPFDLHALLGPDFGSSSASDIVVEEDGTILVVGSAYNGSTVRTEAILWRGSGVTSVADGGPSRDGLRLLVAPNPIRDGAEISFDLARSAPVRVEVFDATGRRIAVLADGLRGPGPQRVSWPMARTESDARSGVRFVRLSSDGRVWTTKAVILR